MSAGERISPMHCPYCGEEDLRPHADPTAAGEPAPPGAWECRSCTRVFTVTFIGLVVRK
jgi:transposase-like protein